jgi:hypothetical protein
MDTNLKPSQRVAVVAAVNPVSSSSVVTSGWVDMAGWYAMMAIISAGALGASATVDAKLEQATSAAGAGAKVVTGKTITQLTKAGTDDNKQVIINLKQTDLDFANDFQFVRLSITPATAACLVSGVLLGLDPRYGPASDFDATTVDEIVE